MVDSSPLLRFTATAAAALTSTAVAATYIDAKFHIQKDLSTLYRDWSTNRDWEQAGVYQSP